MGDTSGQSADVGQTAAIADSSAPDNSDEITRAVAAEDSDGLLPTWITSDWPLIGVVSAGAIAALFAFGGAYGVLLALVAEGGTEAILPGFLVGLYLAFSVVGAESSATSAFSTAGDGVEIAIGTRMMPLGLWLLFLLAVWKLLSFAMSRVAKTPPSRFGLVLKTAFALATTLGVLGAILSFDDSTSTDELTSKVSGGAAFMFTFLAVVGVGVVLLWRKGELPVPAALAEPLRKSHSARGMLSSALAGAKAFVLVVGVASIAALVSAVIVADDPAERVLLLVGAPIYLLNLGASAAVMFMGGSVSFSVGLAQNHVSLLNFGFPPGPTAGAAPVYVLPVLAAAPLLVWRQTKQRLERSAPDTDQQIVTTCFQVAIGFAVTAWIVSGLAQFSVGGGSHDLQRGFSALDVEPSVTAALGLGLLWGLLGAFAAGISWGRSHDLMKNMDSLVPAPVEEEAIDVRTETDES